MTEFEKRPYELNYVELVYVSPSSVASLPSQTIRVIMSLEDASKYLSEYLANCASQPAHYVGEGKR